MGKQLVHMRDPGYLPVQGVVLWQAGAEWLGDAQCDVGYRRALCSLKWRRPEHMHAQWKYVTCPRCLGKRTAQGVEPDGS